MVNSDILRLQLAPALDLGLKDLFGKPLVIFAYQLPGGVALLGVLFSDERILWRRSYQRKAPVADAESDLSTARQVAEEVPSPEPPEVAEPAVGPNEKKSEMDAVDADNLTEIFGRLGQPATPKPE